MSLPARQVPELSLSSPFLARRHVLPRRATRTGRFGGRHSRLSYVAETISLLVLVVSLLNSRIDGPLGLYGVVRTDKTVILDSVDGGDRP